MKGTLKYSKVADAGYNEKGEAIPLTKDDYSVEVECKYTMNVSSSKGVYVDGEFTKCEFTILIDNMDFNAKIVKLYDSQKILVCEKDVLSIQRLEEVQRVKISI